MRASWPARSDAPAAASAGLTPQRARSPPPPPPSSSWATSSETLGHFWGPLGSNFSRPSWPTSSCEGNLNQIELIQMNYAAAYVGPSGSSQFDGYTLPCLPAGTLFGRFLGRLWGAEGGLHAVILVRRLVTQLQASPDVAQQVLHLLPFQRPRGARGKGVPARGCRPDPRGYPSAKVFSSGDSSFRTVQRIKNALGVYCVPQTSATHPAIIVHIRRYVVPGVDHPLGSRSLLLTQDISCTSAKVFTSGEKETLKGGLRC
jgi:hypothetical protein